ncbi:MAG: class C sortase [Suipraeoptans sp.]
MKKKNKKILSLIFAILFLVFIGVIDYPFIAQWYNGINQTDVAREYEKESSQLSEDEKERAIQEAVNYNMSLAEEAEVSLKMPFEEDTESSGKYLGLLNYHKEGVMASIEIPRIDAYLPIYHGVKEEVLQKGVGHLEGSSLPIGGESTHAVLSAHRAIPTKRLFTDLDILEEGDVFLIRVYGEVLAYQVYETTVVTPDQIDPLKIIKGADLVTLITCTPYGVNTHRIYVHANRIPYAEAMDLIAQTEEKGILAKYWWLILTIVLLIWMFLMLYLFNRNSKEKK